MALPEKKRDRRSDLSLRAELANIEQLVTNLRANDELPAGEKLKWKVYYEDERERLQLKLKLPDLRTSLKFAAAIYEFATSPAGKKKAHRRAQMILAGRIGGAGQGRMAWSDIREDTHEKQAKKDLKGAEIAVDNAMKRIRYLQRRNAGLKRMAMNAPPI